MDGELTGIKVSTLSKELILQLKVLTRDFEMSTHMDRGQIG